MPRFYKNPDFFIGLGGLTIGLVILSVWIPLDVETGLIEKVRSRIVIGDAMAPSLAASILVVGGLLLILQSFRSTGKFNFSWNSLKFLILLVILLGLSLAVMRWAGPLTGRLLSADYRSLRDTVPWKYIGYFWGGTFMIYSLICFMEHRLRWVTLVISILVVVSLILLYDMPFDTLLLPPNGDL